MDENQRPATGVLMFNSTLVLLSRSEKAGFAALLPLTFMKLENPHRNTSSVFAILSRHSHLYYFACQHKWQEDDVT